MHQVWSFSSAYSNMCNTDLCYWHTYSLGCSVKRIKAFSSFLADLHFITKECLLVAQVRHVIYVTLIRYTWLSIVMFLWPWPSPWDINWMFFSPNKLEQGGIWLALDLVSKKDYEKSQIWCECRAILML